MTFRLELKRKPNNLPSEEGISKAEKYLGYKFPPSYISFVKNYGTGLLCGFFNIFVPGVSNNNLALEKRAVEYEKMRLRDKTHLTYWKDAKPPVNIPWLKTLRVFGSSDNGDLLCWDINNPRMNNEYPIYFLDNEEACIIHAGDSIDDFIEGFCINGKIDELYPLGKNEKWNLPHTFIPYT